MPSAAFTTWTTVRARALDEIVRAHESVGGTKRGRRYATQHINQSYVVMLASHFQGFCRDLHTECINHVVNHVATSAMIRPILRAELDRNRQLESKNAQAGSIGADFGRLGISFWAEVDHHDAANEGRRKVLEQLNEWRNAIAHQDFKPAKLDGRSTVHLQQVRRWRRVCERLAISFDAVMLTYMTNLTGTAPW